MGDELNWSTVSVEWYCQNITEWQINHAASLCSSLCKSKVVRIRSGIHNTMKVQDVSKGKSYRPDEDGYHYTAEAKNHRTGRWYTYHYYTKILTESDSKIVFVCNNKVEGNPRIWHGTVSITEKRGMKKYGSAIVKVYH